MPNDAIGSVLIIPDSVLKKMDDADKKLARLQDTINKTGSVAATSFRNMANGVYGFSTALDAIIAKLKTVETSSANASAAFNNMKGGNLANAAAQAEKLGASITRAAENIDRLNNKGNTSPLTASAKQYEAIIERLAGIETQLYNKNERLRANDARRAEEAAERKARAAERAAEREAKAAERAAKAQEKARQQQIKAQNSTYQGSLDFASNATSINQRTQAVKYLQAARASLSTTDSEYASKLNTLNARIKELNAANNAAIAGSKNLVNEHRKLLDTTGQLSRAFALLFSVSQIRGYIESIANVRGEFEMSQRSLEAILQNKTQADQIFAQTVELAVKSPYRIKDLVSYTRQLAAYRIESDKLFDTTKRLADVSAGLGVDMSRLILAYGQVKAAAYLRGTEVRQFTEAGINMYGELQRYFQEVKGEAYTTAQIVDMISKRMVTFQDVEAVFKRMTDEGGLFYNMQEIQSETLQGKISNFKDSIDVMLNSIGKANEETFKGAIDTATELLEHWQEIVAVGEALIGVLGLLKLYSLQTGNAMKTIFTANFATNGAKAVTTLNLLSTGLTKAGAAAKMFGTNLWAAFKTNLPLLAITALVSAIYGFINWISTAREEITKINKENGKLVASLRQIKREYDNISESSPYNIEDRKKQIQELQKLYEQEDLSMPVKLELVTDENIDEAFNKSSEYFEQYIKFKKAVDLAFADNNARWELGGVLGNNINEDAQDFADAYNKVIDTTHNVEDAINLLYDSYDRLSKAQKKILDDSSIRKEGQSDLEFLQQRADAVQKITREIGLSLDKNINKAKDLGESFYYDGYGDYKIAAEEFENELDDIQERIKKRFSSADWEKNSTVYLKTAIDKKLAQEEWDETAAEFARRYWKINVEVDESSLDNTINRVDAAIEDFFARKKYNINFTVTQRGNGYFGDLDEINKRADKAIKNIEKTRKELKQLKSSNLDTDIFSSQYMNIGKQRVKMSLPRQEFEKLRKEAIATREEQLKADTAFIISVGRGDEIVEKSTKKRNNAAKQQRDILREQISLLKEMMEVYEKLTPMMSDENAAKRVLEEYRDDLQYVKMDKSIIDSFVPTKEGLIKALNQLLPTITDFKKKAEVMKLKSKYEIEIDSDELKKQLDGVKDEIDNAFNGLSLYDKLKDLGLSDVEIKRLFGPVTKSFAELREQIEQTFAARFGADKGKWGDDIQKLYKEQTEKLAKQQDQQAVSEFERLTKAYKAHLDDQLQLDLWYAKERRAILENEQLASDKQMRSEYMANLDKQYAQKSDDNAWKQFQQSDYYIRMFEDLEGASTRMLNAMSEKLASLRESLKNLSPEQLKQVVDAQQKVDEIAAQRNPFKTLSKNLGSYIRNLKKRKQLENEIIELTKQQEKVDKETKTQNQIVDASKQAYENAVLQYGAESEQAKNANERYQIDVQILNNLKQQSAEYQKQIDSTSSLLSSIIEINQQTKGALSKAGSTFGEAASVINGVFESLNDWGLNVEMPPELEEIAGGFEKIDSSLQQIVSGKVISGTVSLIGGIGKTLGGIFGWGTKDKKLEKKIQKLTKNVENLQHAYEDLEQAQADAWSITDLDEYTEKMVENLELQNRNIQSMIAAEKAKKKTDNDRVEELQEQYEENLKAIEEAKDTLQEQLGGFGSKTNYKSAAQAFGDAWVDAFNEGSDTLAALEDQLDEVFDNLLKKQVSYRVADKIINSLLKPLDEALVNYDGTQSSSLENIRQALDEIREKSPETLEAFNEAMQAIADTLGFDFGAGADAESNLSALQQGIQGVTEQTAEALEALLNSIRFFVAKQTEDIAAIRALLSGSQAIDVSASDNPMVTILREQAGYLKNMLSIMTDMWNQAFAPGHPKGGRGLKVFM